IKMFNALMTQSIRRYTIDNTAKFNDYTKTDNFQRGLTLVGVGVSGWAVMNSVVDRSVRPIYT
ncbi:941_t:CDS:2, partial [Funneliformis geosporum]